MADTCVKSGWKAALAWATSALKSTKRCGKKRSNTIETVQS